MKLHSIHTSLSLRNRAALSDSRKLALTLTAGCIASLAGCAGNPLNGIANSWNQATRVPPPATGAFQPTGGNYSGPGPASASANGAPAAGSPPANAFKSSQNTSSGVPLVDNIVAAESQFKAATDNARNAVVQSTNSINSQVELASARLNRLGDGVVQASQVLSDAARDPIPVPPVTPSTSFATSPTGLPGTSGYAAPPTGSLPSTSSNGRIGDTVEDPNAAWRKPAPR
jgi:hypothetical protein